MSKFFVKGKATTGPEDWKPVVGKNKWKTGKSAKAFGYCWEEAGGFPLEVKRVFEQSGIEQLKGVDFLRGYPEHRTPLPGRGGSSASDLFIVAKSYDSLMTIAVEGKVAEGFGKTVAEWKPESSENQMTRLTGLCNWLDLPFSSVGDIKYQLIHRTAAALIEAGKYRANHALMLVHSFSQDDNHFEDYQDFLDLLSADGENSVPNSVSYAGEKNGINLYLAWVRGEERFLGK